MIFDIAVGSAIGVTISSVLVLAVRVLIRMLNVKRTRARYEEQLAALEKAYAAANPGSTR